MLAPLASFRWRSHLVRDVAAVELSLELAHHLQQLSLPLTARRCSLQPPTPDAVARLPQSAGCTPRHAAL